LAFALAFTAPRDGADMVESVAFVVAVLLVAVDVAADTAVDAWEAAGLVGRPKLVELVGREERVEGCWERWWRGSMPGSSTAVDVAVFGEGRDGIGIVTTPSVPVAWELEFRWTPVPDGEGSGAGEEDPAGELSEIEELLSWDMFMLAKAVATPDIWEGPGLVMGWEMLVDR
jgi:hypothetical protein